MFPRCTLHDACLGLDYGIQKFTSLSMTSENVRVDSSKGRTLQKKAENIGKYHENQLVRTLENKGF